MSIRLMNLAFSVVLPPTQKLVLIRLCDYANDEGLCWPSINQLAIAACISDRQTQRVMKTMIESGLLLVVKNEKGGKAGETRHYRVNESKLSVPVVKTSRRRSTGVKMSPVPQGEVIHTGDNMSSVTGDTDDTRQDETRVTSVTQTGDTHVTPRVTLVTQTGDMGVTLTTIEPPINHHRTTSIPPTAEAADAGDESETALQTACKATWSAYVAAYRERYNTDPVRNAMVNTAVKSFVQRVGHDEAPKVAEFYVWINDQFLIRNFHAFQHLTKSAEAYRTQWATGRAMNSTTARQTEKTASNLSAVEEAKRIVNQRRANANAYRGATV